MKIKNLLHSILVLVFIFAFSVFAQTPPVETAASQNNQTSTDENFELNIAAERITETDFARSTNVELTGNNRGK